VNLVLSGFRSASLHGAVCEPVLPSHS
jgi:hypothetical protein